MLCYFWKVRNTSTCIDQQKALKRDFIYNMIYCSRKKGLRHLFACAIKYLTNTDVPARLAHVLRYARID